MYIGLGYENSSDVSFVSLSRIEGMRRWIQRRWFGFLEYPEHESVWLVLAM